MDHKDVLKQEGMEHYWDAIRYLKGQGVECFNHFEQYNSQCLACSCAKHMSQWHTKKAKLENTIAKAEPLELLAKADIQGKLHYVSDYPSKIFDAENNTIYDVRGWGKQRYKHTGEQAMQARADLIVNLINNLTQ